MPYKRDGKPDYSLVNRDMLDPGVEALTAGVTKHGRLNYLTNPDVTDDELIAAARRHVLEDPLKRDPEGFTHGGAAMANLWMYFHRQAAKRAGQTAAPTEPVADQCTVPLRPRCTKHTIVPSLHCVVCFPLD